MVKFDMSDFVVTSQARQELKEARTVVNGCSDNGQPSTDDAGERDSD